MGSRLIVLNAIFSLQNFQLSISLRDVANHYIRKHLCVFLLKYLEMSSTETEIFVLRHHCSKYLKFVQKRVIIKKK